MMEQARLGNSAVAVSTIGLGTAALGGMYTSVSDADTEALVALAIDRGLTYFDTAPQYGHGMAERRLGRALQTVDRDSYVLSTKVGRLVIDDPNARSDRFMDAPPSRVEFFFDGESIKRSLSESLERLGLDRVDIVYLHDPDDHMDQAIAEAYPVLHEMRAQGVVGAIGAGMNVSAPLTRFVTETELDAVLLAGRYTLLDQTSLVDLIPAARERDVSVVIGGVFNSGILGDPDNNPMFDYDPASPEVIARARAIRDICVAHGVTLVEAAVAFAMREPAVTTVLLGARNVGELEQNLAVDPSAIPDELWGELAEEGLIHELES